MTPTIPYLLAEDLNAHLLLATSQLDFLLDEADHHLEHGQADALQAFTKSLEAPFDYLAELAAPLEETYAQSNTPYRESIRQRAERRLHDVKERIHTSGLNAYASDSFAMTTEDGVVTVFLLYTVLNALAGYAAQRTLAEAVYNQSIPPEQRWANLCALYESMALTRKYFQGPSELVEQLKQLTTDHDLAWMRLDQLMTEALEEELPQFAAMAALCRDSGITHPSPRSLDCPDAVRVMAKHHQPENEWELGAWYFETDEYGLLGIIRFDHNGERHVKTIAEPYPDGYPPNLVQDQMFDLLYSLDEASVNDNPNFKHLYVTANAMYEAATQGMHTLSYLHLEVFMDEVREQLDDQTVGDYIFRSATVHNRDLGILMSPPGTEPPPLANPQQAAAILAAARDSGMSNTQLWELALVMGVKPEEHGLAAPRINRELLYTLNQSSDMFGIPQILVDRLTDALRVR